MITSFGTKQLLLITLALSAVGVAKANTFTYQIAGAASATVALSTDTITITLTDLYVNPGDVTENLSAFWFTTSNATTSQSITSSSADSIDVAANGSFTDQGTVAPGWALTYLSAVTKLDDLGPGGAGPDHTIIGAPGTGNLYSNGNGSIDGNGPHNPFLYLSSSWTLHETGITSATTLSNVYFMFGTAENAGIAGSLVSNPEPRTLLLLVGALPLLAFRRFRNLFVSSRA